MLEELCILYYLQRWHAWNRRWEYFEGISAFVMCVCSVLSSYFACWRVFNIWSVMCICSLDIVSIYLAVKAWPSWRDLVSALYHMANLRYRMWRAAAVKAFAPSVSPEIVVRRMHGSSFIMLVHPVAEDAFHWLTSRYLSPRYLFSLLRAAKALDREDSEEVVEVKLRNLPGWAVMSEEEKAAHGLDGICYRNEERGLVVSEHYRAYGLFLEEARESTAYEAQWEDRGILRTAYSEEGRLWCGEFNRKWLLSGTTEEVLTRLADLCRSDIPVDVLEEFQNS